MRVEIEVKEGKEAGSQRSVEKQDACRLDGSRSRPARACTRARHTDWIRKGREWRHTQ